MNTYRWNAQDYAQNSQAQQQWAKELIALLQLTGHEIVLDLGCGDGKVTAEIARIVDRGVGIDNAEVIIAVAKHGYPEKQHLNLSFRVMDAGNLSFAECFDVVFSNEVLLCRPSKSPNGHFSRHSRRLPCKSKMAGGYSLSCWRGRG